MSDRMNEAHISKAQAWYLASRPKTLLAAFVPVSVGASIAFADGAFNIVATIIALLCSILIQIGTNFTNDLYDFYKGADSKKRTGPLRVVSAGIISAKEMRLGVIAVFGTAFLLGLYLVWLGGITILIIGVLSIIAGFAYTAGPFPLAYKGLGDVFVFLFFGIVATVGSYYVNALEFSWIAFIASLPVGALITNILVVNNYRDLEQDKESGKNTLAVMLGKRFTFYEYLTLLIGSFFVPLIIFLHYDVSGWIFLPYLTMPFAYKLVLMLMRLSGTQLNKALELTAKLSMAFGILLSLGFIL
jgi:1,4-dihydroxy-2-naphthoate octaprenyltransferase